MLGEDYARKTQYIEVAELNNIIIMFPQTTATPLSPAACWDWMGYTGLLTYRKLRINMRLKFETMFELCFTRRIILPLIITL